MAAVDAKGDPINRVSKTEVAISVLAAAVRRIAALEVRIAELED